MHDVDSIKKADWGQRYGKTKSTELNWIYGKQAELLLQDFLGKIQGNVIRIADYGGGNALVARKVIEYCKKRINDFVIENIDVDNSKFIDIPHLVNVDKDFLKYREKERYDYSMSRYVLHYLADAEQITFLENVFYNLKPGGWFVLGNWFIDDLKEYAISRAMLDFVEKRKGIPHRNIISLESTKKLVQEIGFRLVNVKEVEYRFSIEDALKNRHDLTEDEVKELEGMLSVKGNKQISASLLLKKES